jgi:hypothetical protein
MKATLEHLVDCCHGDDRPDCPPASYRKPEIRQT